MVLSLVELATLKCIQHPGLVEDVGTTPFHLLVPVLERMLAKQLRQIESKSPHIITDLERIWRLLIRKDFPDRPEVLPTQPSLRQLYAQYVEDREQLRKQSADRLRRMNEKLQNLKSKITTVPAGVIKEPRRRPMVWGKAQLYGSGGAGGWDTSRRPKTILARAKRDLADRELMFKVAPLRSSSAKVLLKYPQVVAPPRPRSTTTTTTTVTPPIPTPRSRPLGSAQLRSTNNSTAGQTVPPPPPLRHPLPAENNNTTSISPSPEPATSSPPPTTAGTAGTVRVRKRPASASIFMPTRRTATPVALAPPRPPKRPKPPPSSPQPRRRPIKATRSSIFS